MRRRKIYYPEGDGKPMAETDPHIRQIIRVLLVLEHWLRNHEKVYAGANMFLYYQKGNPKRRLAPDVFVAWGVGKHPRRSYKLWEEERAPQVVFEITSRKTQEEDLGKKRLIYAQIGVTEYYLFDPFAQYLQPPLRGYQLVVDEYAPRAVETLAPPMMPFAAASVSSQGWRLTSAKLGLELWALATGDPRKPYVLRFYDPNAQEWLIDPEQALVEQKTLASQLREAEAYRREAEERAARLEAELQKLRGKSPKHEA
jgi:Uma2 family endonuclease